MRSIGGLSLGVAAVLFVLFFSNVALGAFQGSAPLGDVPEMLTLFAAAVAFVVCVLSRERETPPTQD